MISVSDSPFHSVPPPRFQTCFVSRSRSNAINIIIIHYYIIIIYYSYYYYYSIPCFEMKNEADWWNTLIQAHWWRGGTSNSAGTCTWWRPSPRTWCWHSVPGTRTISCTRCYSRGSTSCKRATSEGCTICSAAAASRSSISGRRAWTTPPGEEDPSIWSGGWLWWGCCPRYSSAPGSCGNETNKG